MAADSGLAATEGHSICGKCAWYGGFAVKKVGHTCDYPDRPAAPMYFPNTKLKFNARAWVKQCNSNKALLLQSA